MHQNLPFSAQTFKKILEEVAQPPPHTPPPVGRGHPLRKPHPLGASFLVLAMIRLPTCYTVDTRV